MSKGPITKAELQEHEECDRRILGLEAENKRLREFVEIVRRYIQTAEEYRGQPYLDMVNAIPSWKENNA